MLGCSLAPTLQAAGHDIIKQSRNVGYDVKLNLLDDNDWRDCINELQPDVVINLAAATNVDLCEHNPQLAFDANVAPLLSLKRASSHIKKRPYLIHISTDQLYDGVGTHSESNVHPCNVYALSKFAAELAINDYQATILRTNFFGLSKSPNRQSFSDWIIKSIESNSSITLFQDVLFNAVHISTLCYVIGLIIDNQTIGTFNVGASNGISKSEFGLQLATMLGLETNKIKIGYISDFEFLARRPLDMRMNTSNFENVFSFTFPSMLTEISKAANEYKN
ncbi:dTDP-4-dehydrorhamnose reductase family protein [Synechococcus sp. A18-40]|nr:dTDP-4-dehydrorhamnose reductase family protein [Synechococcus sp. A18-40]